MVTRSFCSWKHNWLTRKASNPPISKASMPLEDYAWCRLSPKAKQSSAYSLHSNGPSTKHTSPEDIHVTFPHGMKDINNRKPLPFSRPILESVMQMFHLPAATPCVLFIKSSHFQRHSISNGELPAYIGRTYWKFNKIYGITLIYGWFLGNTMRRSTRGILALNMSLSLSHDPSTGIHCPCSRLPWDYCSLQTRQLRDERHSFLGDRFLTRHIHCRNFLIHSHRLVEVTW